MIYGMLMPVHHKVVLWWMIIQLPWGCYDAISQSTGLGNTFDQNGYYDLYDYRSPNDGYLSNQFKTGLNGQFATGNWQHQLNVELTHTYKDMHNMMQLMNGLVRGMFSQNVGDVTPPQPLA